MESIRIWAPTEAARLGAEVGELVEVSEEMAAEFRERGIASGREGAVESAMTGPRQTATAPAGTGKRR